MSLFKKKDDMEMTDEELEEYGGRPRMSKKVLLVIFLVLLGIVAGVVVALVSVSSKNEVERQDNLAKQMQQYVASASALNSGEEPFGQRTFIDTSIALRDFSTEFNKLSNGMLMSYNDGASYARGSSDPYGTPYYITAKKDYENANLSTYSFYLTSAGPNRNFDTQNFTLDDDDVNVCLISGKNSLTSGELTDSEVEKTDGNSNNNFGISDIVEAKLDELKNGSVEDTTNENTGYIDENGNQVKDGSLPYRVTISLNQQGGEGGTASVRVKNGVHLKSYSVKTPTKENYEFMGYYSEADAVGTKYFDMNGIGQKYAAFETDTTLFAAWQGVEAIVSLNNTGGTGLTSITARYGSALPNVTVPKRDNYNFIGYYDQPEGEGNKYYDSNGKGLIPSALTRNTMLYAYWTADSFRVEHYVMSLDGNYPSTPIKSETIPNTGSSQIRMSDLADKDLVVPNGIVFSYGTVNGSQNVWVGARDRDTLVCVYYDRCSYTVTVNGDEGIDEVTGQGSYLYGERVTLEAKTLDGYAWSRWTDGITNSWANASQRWNFVMGTQSLVYEATTEPETYTITLNPNGGTCKTKSVSVKYGDRYFEKLPVATRTGFVFSGWSTSRTGNVIRDTARYENSSDVTLYAVWVADEVTVNLDFRGGQGGTTSVIARYGQALPNINSLPTKTGYRFAGYYEKENAQGRYYYDSSGRGVITAEMTTNTTLYAYWTPVSYTIVYFDKGGSNFSGTHGFGYPTSARYGETIALVNPTKPGYVFDGWYSNVNCTGNPLTSVNAADFSGTTINLFAKWSLYNAKLTFDLQGATTDTSDQLTDITATYLSAISDLPASAIPEKEGHSFGGFYTAKNGEGTMVYNASGVSQIVSSSFTKDTTLYAYWR